MPFPCQQEHCSSHAVVAYPESKYPLFCTSHKKTGMMTVISGWCNEDGCNRKPSFGFIGEKPKFCAAHKLGGMVDVKNKRCEMRGCCKTPNFGIPGGRPKFCSTHKHSGHVNVKGPFCVQNNCGKRRTLSRYCIDHISAAETTNEESLKETIEELRFQLEEKSERISYLEKRLSLQDKYSCPEHILVNPEEVYGHTNLLYMLPRPVTEESSIRKSFIDLSSDSSSRRYREDVVELQFIQPTKRALYSNHYESGFTAHTNI